MRLFGKNVTIKEAWEITREIDKKLEAVIDAAVGDNHRDYEEFDCEGEPFIYHGKKVVAHVSKNMIDAYWCSIEDDVAHTEYNINCSYISYEELEARVVKYIKAMCQY